MTQGYILKITHNRNNVFVRSVETGQFAEPVPNFSHSYNSALVVFISLKESFITHVAFGRPGLRAGTDLRRLNLEGIHTLSTPLSFTEIIKYSSSNVRHHITSVLMNGGILPPKSFAGVISAIYEIDSSISPLLNQYSTQRHKVIMRLSERTRESLAAQKEALSTAFNLANLDRKPLLEWVPDKEIQPTSFLDGLPRAYIREDQMVINDLGHMPGLNKVRASITGTARFEGRGVGLDVILANRTRLEEQTGADLIYYNTTYSSFVMVQYKAMEQASDDFEAVFRIPNKQLSEEIARMDILAEQLKIATPPSNRDGYRFDENPFFLKLCPRIILDPDSIALTTGMYFSRDHWRFLETDMDLVGSRGGRLITFKNAHRYLTNTQFVDFVQNAWVGTTPEQSFMLEPLILEILKSGKAVILAVKSNTETPLLD